MVVDFFVHVVAIFGSGRILDLLKDHLVISGFEESVIQNSLEATMDGFEALSGRLVLVRNDRKIRFEV